MSAAALAMRPVQLADLRDQVGGEAAQRLAGGIAGPDPAQELGGPLGGEVTLGAGRDEVGEHDMGPAPSTTGPSRPLRSLRT
jgi:hypothetical protein